MSDPEKQVIETQNSSMADEFARQFANFIRNNLASHQSPKSPSETISHKIDTQPLFIGFKLNGNNYSLWAVLMKTAISGNLPQWQQADHCVFTWLIQNLEPKLVNSVPQQPTAKHIGDNLAVTGTNGGDRIQVYDLHRRANTLKQKNENPKDLWTTFQELWITIDQRQPNPLENPKDIDAHNRLIQEQRLYQFLIALDDKYETKKMEILKIEPLPSVEQAYNIMRREDARAQILRTGSTDEKPSADGIRAGLVVRDQGRQTTIPRLHAAAAAGITGMNGGPRKISPGSVPGVVGGETWQVTATTASHAVESGRPCRCDHRRGGVSQNPGPEDRGGGTPFIAIEGRGVAPSRGNERLQPAPMYALSQMVSANVATGGIAIGGGTVPFPALNSGGGANERE